MSRHPTVLILFLGGSTLDERPRRLATVRQASDINGWLAQLGEMNVIADTTGVFIHDGLAPVGLADWAAAAKAIAQHYRQFDGFVVVHQVATIPTAATALSLMLERLGKPVVIVGSPLLSAAEKAAGWVVENKSTVNQLGVRANFINSLQVAVSDVGEVVVVSGHQLYRGRDFYGPLNHPAIEPFGKIDFGVRFLRGCQRRRRGPVVVKSAYESRVAVIEYAPGLDISHLARQAADSRGVFLTSANRLAIPDRVIGVIAAAIGRSIPIVYHGNLVGRSPGLITVSGDRQNCLVRFLWALGQSRQAATIRRLMKV